MLLDDLRGHIFHMHYSISVLFDYIIGSWVRVGVKSYIDVHNKLFFTFKHNEGSLLFTLIIMCMLCKFV